MSSTTNVLILRLYKPDFILNLGIAIFNPYIHSFLLLFIEQNICCQCPKLILCWMLNSEISNLDRVQVPK